MLEHKNFKYGEHVIIRGVSDDLNGLVVRVVGVASRHIIDIYIVELLEDGVETMKDGTEYSSFTMPEGNLEAV